MTDIIKPILGSKDFWKNVFEPISSNSDVITQLISAIEEKEASKINLVLQLLDKKWIRQIPILAKAVQTEDTTLVKCLIGANVDIEQEDEAGWSAAAYAAHCNNLTILQFIVERDRSVLHERHTPLKCTLLHLAAQNACMEVLLYLLEEVHVNIEAEDKDNKTALRYAARAGKLDVIEILVSKHALLYKSLGNDSVLSDAVSSECPEALQFLLKQSQAASEGQKTFALVKALEVNHLSALYHLLENGANLKLALEIEPQLLYRLLTEDKEEIFQCLWDRRFSMDLEWSQVQSLFKRALRQKRLPILSIIVRSLRRKELETLDEMGKAVVHHCAALGEDSILNLLIDHGADLNMVTGSGETILDIAIDEGHIDMIKGILEKESPMLTFDEEISLQPAVERAIKKGQGELMGLFLVEFFNTSESSAGCNNARGETPLHLSVRYEQPEIFNCLMSLYGTSLLEERDEDLLTPLGRAVHGRHADFVQLLLKQGADAKVIGQCGKTLLHLNAERGGETITHCLLEKKVDPYALDNLGNTAIHYAAIYDRVDVAGVLLHLDKGFMNIQGNDDLLPIAAAVKAGSLEMVEYLLSKDADVDIQTEDDRTLLHLNAQNGNASITKMLLDEGLDPELTDSANLSVLQIALTVGHVEVVQTLVRHQATLLEKDVAGRTPLLQAVAMGHEKMVEMLLREGANVSAVCGTKWSTLHLNAKQGSKTITELLIGAWTACKDICVDSNGDSPLHIAAKNDRVDVARVLLSRRLDLLNMKNLQGETALSLAAEKEKINMVEYLLSMNADPQIKDCFLKTPLHHNAGTGNESIARLLIDAGSNIEGRARGGVTPFYVAVMASHLKIAQLMLSENDKALNMKESNENTPLMQAVINEDEKMVSFLLQSGASVNDKNKSGQTALHLNALYGNAAITQLLLHHKAEPLTYTMEGETAIHVAAENHNMSVVKALTKFRKNLLETQNRQHGDTPLIKAVYGKRRAMVAFLLNEGANVHAVNKANAMPLHVNAGRGNAAITELLLNHGADPTLLGKHGETPLHIAAGNNMMDVVKVLLKGRKNLLTLKALDGKTPLLEAAAGNHYEMVEFLVENGAFR